MLQKATQDARGLNAMTRERDRLLQELAACTQKLTASASRAAEQDATVAQNSGQLLQVRRCTLFVEALISHAMLAVCCAAATAPQQCSANCICGVTCKLRL